MIHLVKITNKTVFNGKRLDYSINSHNAQLF